MKRIRSRRRSRKRARIGAPDESLTGSSGVLALSELVERLGVIEVLDDQIGPVKVRDRGATGGELVVALAQSQLLGADGLVGLDRDRADVAARHLSVIPAVPSTTAGSLARRFGLVQLAGVEAGSVALTHRTVAVGVAR